MVCVRARTVTLVTNSGALLLVDSSYTLDIQKRSLGMSQMQLREAMLARMDHTPRRHEALCMYACMRAT